MAYCPNCGKNVGDERFCSYCGSPINSNNPSESAQFADDSDTVVQGGNGNGFAIAGFVLAFFMPILGIIFSCIGMSKAKQMKGNGHGLALAGLIISIVSIVLSVILIIVYASMWHDVMTWY